MLIKGIFIGIIILLLLHIYFQSSIENYEPNNKLEYIPDQHVDILYEITKFMIDFFNRHDIYYWAIGGTLIGLLRNNPPGPIRWDDDVDVGIFNKDKKKLIYAMKTDPEFKKKIKVKWHNFGYQLRLKSDTFLYKDYYFDIFVYKRMKGKHGVKYYCGVPEFDDFYYNTIKEILPLKMTKCWDLDISIPNDINTVQRGYEDDVIRYGVIYNHKYYNNKCDLQKEINSCNLVPMLSKNIITKLQFTN